MSAELVGAAEGPQGARPAPVPDSLVDCSLGRHGGRAAAAEQGRSSLPIRLRQADAASSGLKPTLAAAVAAAVAAEVAAGAKRAGAPSHAPPVRLQPGREGRGPSRVEPVMPGRAGVVSVASPRTGSGRPGAWPGRASESLPVGGDAPRMPG